MNTEDSYINAKHIVIALILLTIAVFLVVYGINPYYTAKMIYSGNDTLIMFLVNNYNIINLVFFFLYSYSLYRIGIFIVLRRELKLVSLNENELKLKGD